MIKTNPDSTSKDFQSNFSLKEFGIDTFYAKNTPITYGDVGHNGMMVRNYDDDFVCHVGDFLH